MNTDTLQGQWKQIKGKIKAQWGKLTDDDLQVIDGNIEKLVGKVQALYGQSRDAVHKKVQALADEIGDIDLPKPD